LFQTSVYDFRVSTLIKSLSHPLGLVAGLLALVGTAQSATDTPGWLPRPWLSDDGLPNNTVYGIAQTPDHYLWIATANGLARFDGLRFEEFSSTNFIKPPDRGILAMSGTAQGGLRLATDRSSLVCLDAGKRRVFTAEDGLPNAPVNALFEDAEQSLWVAYRNGSVCRIKAGQPQVFTEADGLPDGTLICSLAQDEIGRLWFLKGGQLGRFREGRFETLVRVTAAPGRITPAKNGGVWFSSGLRLFYCSEAGTVEELGEISSGRGAAEVSVMVEGRDGAVWIGTTFHGLFRFDGDRFEQVPTTHREILSLMEDAEGTIWVGTGGGGLNQIRPQAVELLTGQSGLPFESVSSLAQETNGVIWAATHDGSLSRLKDGRWHTIPPGPDWFSDALSVAVDASGDVWVGTRSHRLLRWREDRFVPWGDVSQIKGQTIHTLVVARNGDLWVGGGDAPAAIMRLRAGKIDEYELPSDVRIIRASVEDAAGNIWFGSSKGILLRVEGQRLVDETARTTGEPQPIRCLYATPDGGVWIGYAGAGVGLLKDHKFTLFSAKQGLHDDFVSQIVSDERGWMWFGANRGIFRVRRTELDAVATGTANRLRSIHYGQGDGLPSMQANFGNSPTAIRSQDGRIWLAMRTALAVISPHKLRDNSKSPPVLLTRMVVGDRLIAAYGGVLSPAKAPGTEVLDLSLSRRELLKLPPDHRRVEFGFTALSYVGAENVSFRYRLDGIDDGWVDAERRSAVYPRLPYGRYQFRVSACSVEGIWNETEATVAFEVAPFLWETWWFRAVVLAVFTALIIAIVRYVSFRRLRLQLLQLEQQAALHKERARIAKDIHDDLGASLTQISLIGELARQDSATPEKVGAHIEIMSGTARQAVKSLDEIVWAVNPRNDTLAHFIDYTGQFALDYLRLAGVRCRLDLPDHVPHRELSTDVRHNLFLVVKEAINNTVKYAHATELRLRIGVTDEKLELSLEDNGCGFATPPDDATSDGLRNMHQRMADIGGQCWIQGRPGAGAKISIELPWPHDHHPH
jgi:signal transduction histidine kinase/ligand-binding sensor domain-containing protein